MYLFPKKKKEVAEDEEVDRKKEIKKKLGDFDGILPRSSDCLGCRCFDPWVLRPAFQNFGEKIDDFESLLAFFSFSSSSSSSFIIIVLIRRPIRNHATLVTFYDSAIKLLICQEYYGGARQKS